MITYYCAVHKDEDQQALMGCKFDACNSHMVRHTSYDLPSLRDFVDAKDGKPYVIWVMERDRTAKYGWRFKELLGIPH